MTEAPVEEPKGPDADTIALQAKLVVANHRADTFQRAAEADELAVQEIARQKEELIREGGRKDGVIEVLKDKITDPPPPADLKPVSDAVERLNQRFDTLERQKEKAAVTVDRRPGFWKRYSSSREARIVWLIATVLLVLLLWLVFTHPPKEQMVPQPVPDNQESSYPPQDPKECTVAGSVYVELLERCVMLLSESSE